MGANILRRAGLPHGVRSVRIATSEGGSGFLFWVARIALDLKMEEGENLKRILEQEEMEGQA